jgi:hypothetical protein
MSSAAEEQRRENLMNHDVLVVDTGPTAMAADAGQMESWCGTAHDDRVAKQPHGSYQSNTSK